jgi:hypothetical protein
MTLVDALQCDCIPETTTSFLKDEQPGKLIQTPWLASKGSVGLDSPPDKTPGPGSNERRLAWELSKTSPTFSDGE